MKIKYFAVIIFAFCLSNVFAQTVGLEASVSKRTIAMGEPFEISFTANGNIEKFNPPGFSDFRVVGGPNQSSSMTSINGKTTVSIALSYDLIAVREGEYTIGTASATIDGKSYQSKPIKINVVKGNSASQSSGNNRAAAPDNLTTGNNSDIAQHLFIKAVANKTSVYQGEQITVTYKLYTNVSIVDIALDKLPDFNGFWSQEIKNDNQNIPWTQETINGTIYHVTDIKQIILFPERSGKLALDPLGMTFLIRQVVPSNDPIEQIFGGSYKDVKYKIKSTPVTIHVKSLPENGKPDSFQGAVGNFSIDAAIDHSELKANEALNYTLKVSGTGNLKLFRSPKLTFPPAIEAYDPKVSDNIQESLNGVSGSRTYTYLLIPRHEGRHTIAPFEFSYFNPATQKYVTLTTKGYTLAVAKGDPASNVTTFSSRDQQEVKLLDKDVRYIKDTDEFKLSDNTFFGSVGFWVLLFLGPLLFIAAWFYRSWYRKQHKDLAKVKGRNANKVAAKHMANAHKQLQNGDKKLFYEAVYKGLYGYLSDKFTIAAADLNKENIAEQLRLRGKSDSLIDQLIETLDLCEMARYAPVVGTSEQEVYEKAKHIIQAVEKA
ncbi:BatD family protein [Olivibacter ginsenosidimutans]|uniref:BatD family protein n=1 Tax=Olivibacter ginsenosidimutans TaxID=1176537 RepID=A0ABP9B0V6_9SPHI